MQRCLRCKAQQNLVSNIWIFSIFFILNILVQHSGSIFRNISCSLILHQLYFRFIKTQEPASIKFFFLSQVQMVGDSLYFLIKVFTENDIQKVISLSWWNYFNGMWLIFNKFYVVAPQSNLRDFQNVYWQSRLTLEKHAR